MKYQTQAEAAKHWNKQVESNIRERLLLLDGVSSVGDIGFTKFALSQDTPDAFIAFVNDWCWTYNPREKQVKELPFVLWPKQEQIARDLWDIENDNGWLFIEKSRDTGITWLVSAYAVWRWLFAKRWQCGFGTRNEDLLDKDGDPSSLFFKIIFIIEHLPKWMLPDGFDLSKHRKHRQIYNPENKSVITGDVGKNMGRGGRSSLYIIDEFATIEHAESVEAAVSGNTDSIVTITTTTGPGTYVHQVRQRPSTKIASISWDDDPRKHAGFLADYIRQHSPQLAKREYEISWDGDADNQFIPYDWLRTCSLEEPVDTDGYVQAGLDVAAGGADSSVLIIRKGSTIQLIKEWKTLDPVALVDHVIPLCNAYSVQKLVYDETGVGAGVAGALKKKTVSFDYEGVNNGGSPDKTPMWDDGGDVPCNQRFANIKAQQWWNLRSRAKQTVDFSTAGDSFDRMLFIPAMQHSEDLIKELSSPCLELTKANKVAVESKKSLAKRGVKSPDFADACVLAFSEQTEVIISWV